jgi:hypothetical protein
LLGCLLSGGVCRVDVGFEGGLGSPVRHRAVAAPLVVVWRNGGLFMSRIRVRSLVLGVVSGVDLKHLSARRVVLSLLAASVLCLSQAAVASAAGGNSTNVHRCLNGGWQTFVRSDGSPFANLGNCASYAAQGGTLQLVGPAQLCQVFGGTFSTVGGQILWTCDGWTASSAADVNPADLNSKVSKLSLACAEYSNGDAFQSFYTPPFPTTVDSECGIVP